jgi:hypothetical protein
MIETVRVRALTALLALAIAACTSGPPPEPVKIVSIETGAAVDANNRLHSPSMTFAQQSPVYASIATEGTGRGTLLAQWLDQNGKVLHEEKQEINPTGPATFEFHYVPQGGWPIGRHKVVFTINGTGARTREFEAR